MTPLAAAGRDAMGFAMLITLGACAGHGLSRKPAVYPHPSFGRVGCYADQNGSQAMDHGPWLVLDSLDASELTRFPKEGARTGVRVFRADTIVRHAVTWERISGDSIVVHEFAFFASTTWRLRVFADSVRGTATLPHDVFTIVDGKREQLVSRWETRARRVPCAAVPVDARPSGRPITAFY
jgi:hypothetical protein